MTRRWLFGFLLALAPAACSRGPQLAGTWAPVRAEIGGKDLPVAAFNGAILHLTDSTYDFGNDTGAVVLLQGGTSAMMDIKGRAGPNAGRTIAAIYALAGDTLTICYQLGPGARPSEFKSAAGPQVLLVRYTRAP